MLYKIWDWFSSIFFVAIVPLVAVTIIYTLLNPGTFWQRIASGVICVFVAIITMVVSILIGIFLDDLIIKKLKGKDKA